MWITRWIHCVVRVHIVRNIKDGTDNGVCPKENVRMKQETSQFFHNYFCRIAVPELPILSCKAPDMYIWGNKLFLA